MTGTRVPSTGFLLFTRRMVLLDVLLRRPFGPTPSGDPAAITVRQSLRQILQESTFKDISTTLAWEVVLVHCSLPSTIRRIGSFGLVRLEAPMTVSLTGFRLDRMGFTCRGDTSEALHF